MRLRALFLVLCTSLSLAVIGLAANVLRTSLSNLHKADAGLRVADQMGAALRLAEAVSKERGPTNVALGASRPAQNIERGFDVVSARQMSDQAFQVLRDSLDTSEQPALSLIFSRAEEQLLRARAEADRIIQRPASERTYAEVDQAIDGAILAIDIMAPAIAQLTIEASESFPVAADLFEAAHHAAALREHSGRLGSYVVAAMVSSHAIDDAEHTRLQRLIGRLEQLHHQLKEGSAASRADGELREYLHAVDAGYFGAAISLIHQATTALRQDGSVLIDTQSFTGAYVGSMEPIIHLRDKLMSLARDKAVAGIAQSRKEMIVTLVAVGISVLLLVLAWWAVLARVVNPLRRTTKAIVDIANGHLDIRVPAARWRDEMSDMGRAIEVLRHNSIAKKKAHATIRRMAYFDEVTGLPNRRMLEDRLETLLSHSQRKSDAFAVLFIDLDGFKKINDTHGHKRGDWLLGRVAERMRAVLREGDTAARIGGDEFVILVPEVQSKEHALTVAEKIRCEMDQPFLSADGLRFDISSSIGIALYPENGLSSSDLLRFSDEAMYCAKRAGKNQICNSLAH